MIANPPERLTEDRDIRRYVMLYKSESPCKGMVLDDAIPLQGDSGLKNDKNFLILY